MIAYIEQSDICYVRIIVMESTFGDSKADDCAISGGTNL